ncbi:MAG: hypothetical protein QOJ03_291, partial [Frankiaceae bacterium]|nr:hypothetical protein [Frankiaceae bacterium]
MTEGDHPIGYRPSLYDQHAMQPGRQQQALDALGNSLEHES